MDKTGHLVTTFNCYSSDTQRTATEHQVGRGQMLLVSWCRTEWIDSELIIVLIFQLPRDRDSGRKEFKLQLLSSLETLFIVTWFKTQGTIPTSDWKPVFKPRMRYSFLEFSTSHQSHLKGKQLSNLKHQLNLVVCTFLQWQIFEKREIGS